MITIAYGVRECTHRLYNQYSNIMRKTEIRHISKNGDIEICATYLNKYSPIYNLCTHILILNGMAGQIMNDDVRREYEKRIIIGKSKKFAFFNFNDDIYSVSLEYKK